MENATPLLGAPGVKTKRIGESAFLGCATDDPPRMRRSKHAAAASSVQRLQEPRAAVTALDPEIITCATTGASPLRLHQRAGGGVTPLRRGAVSLRSRDPTFFSAQVWIRSGGVCEDVRCAPFIAVAFRLRLSNHGAFF